MLYNEGLSGHVEQKILIQLDTEAQEFDFVPNAHILNKFDVFTSINTTPLDVLLAQKFYAILNRPRKKGRDFFDVLFLLQQTKPNYQYLEQKVNIAKPNELKDAILHTCETADFNELSKDVEPFLFYPKDVKRIKMFASYIQQIFWFTKLEIVDY